MSPGNYASRHKAEFNEDMGCMAEKEIELAIPPNYLQAVDEINDADEVAEYATANNLNAQKLCLWKDLLTLYDEGEYECVVDILNCTVKNKNAKGE